MEGDFRNATGGSSPTTKVVLNDPTDYCVTLGEITEKGDRTYQPIMVKGWQTGKITLTITLTDQRNGTAYDLKMAYTLQEADTKVTATFTDSEGNTVATQTVNYGTTPTAPDEGSLTPPEGQSFAGWTPALTEPLYADTVFRPEFQPKDDDTDAG